MVPTLVRHFFVLLTSGRAKQQIIRSQQILYGGDLYRTVLGCR